jgi:hypothetical protein
VTGATSIVVLGNESSTISGDGVTISVTLANDIMNQIKSSDDLATDLNGTDGTAVNRTFITITAQGVDDMNSNDIVAIVDPALQVSTYKEDAAAALITAFDLNMNTGTLTLEFTETMDLSQVDATAITLQSAANISVGDSFPLTGEVDVDRADDDIIVITLSEDDLANLKLKDSIGLTKGQSFISVQNTFVDDKEGVAVTAISSLTARGADTFTEDSTAPSLEAFSFSLNDGSIELIFDEPVRASTLQTSLLSLVNKETDATASVAISGASASSINDLSLTLNITDAELNEVKLKTGLCTDILDCFISLSNDTVEDIAGVSITSVTKEAISFTNDTTNPTLTEFTYTVDSGATLVLSFDETMESDSLVISSITLQDAATATIEHTLVNADLLSGDGTAFSIAIDSVDVDAIKAKDFCVSRADCFIRITADMATI